ncbi:hypothetical protein KR084_001309, partial [Drosophila pseudotakahashii]
LSLADCFSERDFVFAQATGYVPWPGILKKKLFRAGVVGFMFTNDTKVIPYEKIWPYDDRRKAQFITSQNMEYEEFREAICIVEKLRSGDVDLNTEGGGWQLVSPEELPTGKPIALEQSRANWELNYVREVRLEHESLSVEVEFIHVLNVLRSSLTQKKQDYPSALWAFQELQGLALSELLLVRNFEAVEAMHHLCRFASTQPQDRLMAYQVKNLAIQQMKRFASHFKQSLGTEDFWSAYCLRSRIYRNHTVDIKP